MDKKTIRQLTRHTHPDNTVIWEGAECIVNFTGINHAEDSRVLMQALGQMDAEPELKKQLDTLSKDIRDTIQACRDYDDNDEWTTKRLMVRIQRWFLTVVKPSQEKKDLELMMATSRQLGQSIISAIQKALDEPQNTPATK